jgi:hypothetical protein
MHCVFCDESGLNEVTDIGLADLNGAVFSLIMIDPAAAKEAELLTSDFACLTYKGVDYWFDTVQYTLDPMPISGEWLCSYVYDYTGVITPLRVFVTNYDPQDGSGSADPTVTHNGHIFVSDIGILENINSNVMFENQYAPTVGTTTNRVSAANETAYYVDAGTVNAMVIASSFSMGTTNVYARILFIKAKNTNTSSTVTLKTYSTDTAQSVVLPGGDSVPIGALEAGKVYPFWYDYANTRWCVFLKPEQTSVSGNAGTATKLATARTVQTNLASTESASFDGSANISPGVTGTLPVANGGTGNTTGAATKLATARTIALSGAVTGNASFDGSTNATIVATVIKGGRSAWETNSGDDCSAWGDYALMANTGIQNTAVGVEALKVNTTGSNNTGVGAYTLNSNISGQNNTGIGTFALMANTSGNHNVAIGLDALSHNTTGFYNTALGNYALQANISGSSNTCCGYRAMYASSSSSANTAFGAYAMDNATSGSNNTGVGAYALRNATGNQNTALGAYTLTSNTTGANNVGVGTGAVRQNTTGNYNTGIGTNALYENTTGNNNVGVGYQALFSNTAGISLVAIGSSALASFSSVTEGNQSLVIAVGGSAFTNLIGGMGGIGIGGYAGAQTSSNSNFTNATNSIYIGNNTKASYYTTTNEIVIGAGAVGGGNDTVTLGNSSITQLRCQVTAITALSDRRIKEDIEPANLDLCLADVKRLPIHRYKYKDYTGTHLDTHVTGFLADDVAEVFPKAVSATDQYFPVLDADGNPEMETVERQIETGVDENGDPIYTTETEEREKTFLMEDVKNITMTEALPTLWGAVQKLAAIVELQAVEIAALKGV